MENETLNSTQELSANCEGAAVGAQAVISFANGYSFKKSPLKRQRKEFQFPPKRHFEEVSLSEEQFSPPTSGHFLYL